MRWRSTVSPTSAFASSCSPPFSAFLGYYEKALQVAIQLHGTIKQIKNPFFATIFYAYYKTPELLVRFYEYSHPSALQQQFSTQAASAPANPGKQEEHTSDPTSAPSDPAARSDATVYASPAELGPRVTSRRVLDISACGVTRKQLRQYALESLALLRKFGKFWYPLVQIELLWRGLLQWVDGDRAKAWATWAALEREMERVYMPNLAAPAYRTMARHWDLAQPEEAERLRRRADEVYASFKPRKGGGHDDY